MPGVRKAVCFRDEAGVYNLRVLCWWHNTRWALSDSVAKTKWEVLWVTRIMAVVKKTLGSPQVKLMPADESSLGPAISDPVSGSDTGSLGKMLHPHYAWHPESILLLEPSGDRRHLAILPSHPHHSEPTWEAQDQASVQHRTKCSSLVPRWAFVNDYWSMKHWWNQIWKQSIVFVLDFTRKHLCLNWRQ